MHTTLILNIDENQNHAKGSARSIEQVSMFDILNDHQQLIDKFGGHHMAAGMTMSIDNIEHLHKELNVDERTNCYHFIRAFNKGGCTT